MRISLTATDEALFAAWNDVCGDLPEVNVHHGSLFDLDVDAVVSPANSFGFMRGGIDAQYNRFFGGHVEDRLRALLAAKYDGELPVGGAEILATDHARLRHLICAPTMRVPALVSGTVNAYLAARAALRLVKTGQFAPGSGGHGHVGHVVQSIAFPGLGTGTGGLDPRTCALQVRAAIEQVVLGRTPRYASLDDAMRAHRDLSERVT